MSDGPEIFVQAIKERIAGDVAAAVAEVERGFVSRAAILEQRVAELERDIAELKAKAPK